MTKGHLPCAFIDIIHIHHKRTDLRCVLRSFRYPYCRFECPILAADIKFDTTDTGVFVSVVFGIDGQVSECTAAHQFGECRQ